MRYIGAGFLVGIPSRDLTADEVAACGGVDFLRSTRLYETYPANPVPDQASEEA
jgi:hypothetical protein